MNYPKVAFPVHSQPPNGHLVSVDRNIIEKMLGDIRQGGDLRLRNLACAALNNIAYHNGSHKP